MPKGICIYAEHNEAGLEPAVWELYTAAKQLQKTTGEPISFFLAGKDCDKVVQTLLASDAQTVYVAKTEQNLCCLDDAHSEVLAEMLKRIDPLQVLVLASEEGRSVFPRVAVRLNTGLTADCTDLAIEKREDGQYYTLQNKPSYGDNVMVSIVHKKGVYPEMMTVRAGVYEASCPQEQAQAERVEFNDITYTPSKIQVLDVCEEEEQADSILGANVVVVAGRGVMDEESFPLLEQFAKKIGACVGCTRPVMDAGLVSFERQIGQTGCTIRPKICILFGVSGAIQHTEGIKDPNMYIAVNMDANAPIFSYAHYGVQADAKDILTALNG